MSTYQTQLTSALEGQTISKFWLGYFREALRSEINDALLECFEASGLNKADIARKLDRRPEQITRWISAPCNLETDTVSDLALALGLIPRVRFEKIGRAFLAYDLPMKAGWEASDDKA